MRVAIDTNILAYAVGFSRGGSHDMRVGMAQDTLQRIHAACEIVVATQVLGELYNLGVRGGLDRSAIRAVIVSLQNQYAIAASDRDIFATAVDLAAEHKLQIWDSVILATVADADATLLLSEDMQNGFLWRGVTVINPFAAKLHPLLESLLA